MAVQNYRQIIGLCKYTVYTSVFGDGRISTHADPTPTRRAISRMAHL